MGFWASPVVQAPHTSLRSPPSHSPPPRKALALASASKESPSSGSGRVIACRLFMWHGKLEDR